ncbi:MAG: sn-glycerol-3-phosphate ABC transporter ATP-binding protein UgpC [Elusimicrobia bacterium]|nr:sn-glycerol-3-phosphate ABC transporter ATP-binding protein UgpC [Elusimicrobiota bacterium]
MAEVVLKRVGKLFKSKKSGEDVWAVKDFNLKIKDKEFCIFVGPSGCGKTTTLRMVAGLEDVTEGEIYIGDALVNNVQPKDRNIAMVFQNYALYPHMTVFNNMAFGLKLRKMPKNEIKARVEEAAEILSITHLLNRKPKALSGGQRQRVAVGRAIVRRPKVFLFDEPLSNLDAKLRVQMRTEIKKIHRKLEATIIYVTHDQIEAMTMGDRIVVMKDGLIQQIADPLTLYDQPVNKFVAGFIGSPPMNFITGAVVKKADGLYLEESKLSLKINSPISDLLAHCVDQKVVFGLRPEDIYDKFFARSIPGCCPVKMKVEVIEPMGSEIYVHLSSGNSMFLAKLDSHVKAEVEKDLEVVFNMNKIHIFDAATEKTII